MMVADLGSREFTKSRKRAGRTDVRADARLIAAAPDLLEALRDLAAMADFVAQREPGMDELKARIADARAAIAKATESA